MSVKTEWMRNGIHQDLYVKTEKIIKQGACMMSGDTSKPLYLESDASGIGLGAGLLHVREGMNCG